MKEVLFWRLIKYLLIIFTLILIPVYWRNYGPLNFLWISDIGLFLTVLGLLFRESLLVSMAIVGAMVTELVWCVDYFGELFFGINIIDLSDYMFDANYSFGLRGLSLFHVAMPIIWFLYLIDYGYERRAFWYMTLLYWIMILITYLFTQPVANVNWVFLPLLKPAMGIHPDLWVLLLMIFFPICIFLPTHYVCSRFFKKIL
ncbi:MAG: hypothetical protein AMXMBFR12_03410 [Candidatus Babeliales bacterium]